MKKIFTSIRIFDGIILGVIIFIILGISFFLYTRPHSSAVLVVKSPSGTWMYQLDTDRRISIPGQNGETLIEIKSGRVMVLNSSCPKKTCTTGKPLERAGDWNACLPNRVFLNIEGEQKNKTLDVP